MSTVSRPKFRNREVFPGEKWKPAYTREFSLDFDDDYLEMLLQKLQTYSKTQHDDSKEWFDSLRNELDLKEG